MAHLARAGFNAYAMDLTGYGGSPKPMMDDPCNVDPKQQRDIIPRPLKAACAANYPFELTTITSDWAEIDAVVDYLRQSNGVEKIHLIGWSAGGPRVGGYAALHPEKVERIVLYAPSPTIPGLKIPDQPGSGFPVSVQTREDLEKKRWDPDVRCPGQLEAGIRDVVWKAIMQWDRVGAIWGPEGGLMRGRVATRFGWPPELAAKITVRRRVFEQISSKDKVFLDVACGSHFMLWEKPHPYLHAASLEWLRSGELKGVRRGTFRVDAEGKYSPGN
jgi:pimeloyl-ACP methyl ester carboxylesterase